MQALRLQRTVTVAGLNYWGLKSHIAFKPHPDGAPGWWWRCGDTMVPIDHRIVLAKTRRITLAYGWRRLHIYEHIGALRFAGLDSVLIDGCGWPPYDGSAAQYWDALLPAAAEASYEVPWRAIPRDTSYTYGDNQSRRVVFAAEPNNHELRLLATIDYSGLGRAERVVVLPRDSADFMLDLIPSRSQGWPVWPYPYLRAWQRIALRCRLPHIRVDQMTWPIGQFNTSDVLRAFVTHRLLDMAGAASVVFHDALPSMNFSSVCGGHYGDLMATKQLFSR